MECFDAAAFAISPLEAALMDPQQRCLLESGYAALHAHGFRRANLASQPLGVHVGFEHVDWQLLQAIQNGHTALQKGSIYAATGEQPHVSSGRLAFTLDLHGPCMTINTACSSGLVAAHASAGTLKTDPGCSGVLLAAAKLVLIAYAANAGFLAADGCSRTFDERADGYGRSEAVVAAVTDRQPQSSTFSLSLSGSSVQANGRSASLTAPNGSALSRCMRIAREIAALDPSQLSGMQAQGLGSALADPIEMSAMLEGLPSTRASPLVISCHKANLGHSEAPSGLAGLLTAQPVSYTHLTLPTICSV